MTKAKLTVLIDDNAHYKDERERYVLGEFDTLDVALSACRSIVDNYLANAYEKGMSAGDLYVSYTQFGKDPFIVGAEQLTPFSAWDYAKQRCRELCSDAF